MQPSPARFIWTATALIALIFLISAFLCVDLILPPGPRPSERWAEASQGRGPEYASGGYPGSDPDHTNRIPALQGIDVARTDVGALSVHVLDSNDRPVAGVSLGLLLPRADGGGSWDDAALSALREGGTINACKSGADGLATFRNLRPNPNYQVAVLEVGEGVFRFAAQPNVFVGLPATEDEAREGRAKTLLLDRSVSVKALESNNVSGYVPVHAGATTLTVLRCFVGAVLHGEVVGGPYDKCIVSLSRTDSGVQRTCARSTGVRFEFASLAPVGSYCIDVQMHRGADVYFGTQKVVLREAESKAVTIEPIRPDQATRLHVVNADNGNELRYDVRVIIRFLSQENMLTDVSVAMGRSATLHGVSGSRVMSVQVSGGRVGETWRDPRIEGLVNGCLARAEHNIPMQKVVKGMAWMANVVLAGSANWSYSAPHRMKFEDSEGRFLGSCTVDPVRKETSLMLDWSLVNCVKIQADVPDAAASAMSERVGRIEYVGAVVTVHDPGAPNGIGCAVSGLDGARK